MAIKYENELKDLFYNTWFDEKYKFYNNSTYYNNFKLEDTTWDKHTYVSLDQNQKVIGYISYDVDRQCNYVNCLSIINFSDNKIIFGKDIQKVLKDIFEKFNFIKINFSVIVGNPIEKKYDKLIDYYGGRIVGVFKQHTKLIDNNLYDHKMYEIFREDYYKKKNKQNEI